MANTVNDAGSKVVWWHAFGGVATEGAWEGCYAMSVIGPSPVPPGGTSLDGSEVLGPGSKMGSLEYVTSWDHEPSDEEKEAVTPAEYRDED